MRDRCSVMDIVVGALFIINREVSLSRDRIDNNNRDTKSKIQNPESFAFWPGTFVLSTKQR